MLISWVLYACNICHCHPKLPVFVHSSGRVPCADLADLDRLFTYRCLSGCIYRALGLQIKMDLTQTFRVVFMSDATEGGLSCRPQRPPTGEWFLLYGAAGGRAGMLAVVTRLPMLRTVLFTLPIRQTCTTKRRSPWASCCGPGSWWWRSYSSCWPWTSPATSSTSAASSCVSAASRERGPKATTWRRARPPSCEPHRLCNQK